MIYLKFALRQLLKNPGFTAVAALTLGLGIGANTAIFSVINGVLLRPLPYREVLVTPATLRDWREQNLVFEELGGQIYESVNLTGIERPEHVHAAWTTANYFSVFGVPPLMGRTFIAEDSPPGHRVVVLSHGLWVRSFGGDRRVIGNSITLNGLNYVVVGVMPPDFRIYQPAAVFGLPTGDVQPQLWVPHPGSMTERTNHFFLAFARLKAGVTAAQAQSELCTISERLSQEWPSQKDWGASVQPLNEQIVGGSRPALRLLLGAVAFVLLIACANVANLSLARSVARRKEFAVRSALGAARSRLVHQLLVESTTLAVLGGGLGVLLARWGLAGLMALQPASLPRLDEIRLDGSVLSFTLLVSLFTGLMFGLAPAIHASKPDLNEALKEGGHGCAEGRHRQRVRAILVVAEVALAMMLLAGAGLMINSFVRFSRIHPGFEPEQLVTFDFSLSGGAYAEDSQRISLVRQLRDRVQAKPGIGSVATVYGLPFGTMLNAIVGAIIDGRPESESRARARAALRVVSSDYFRTMGVPLLAGRAFSDELDTLNSPPALIINETFARKYFPGEDPVGRRVQLFTLSSNWHEIVGVIKDVKLTGLDAPATPEVYQSDLQSGVWMFSLVVRSTLPLREIEKMVRAEAAALDKELPTFNVRTMEQAISTSVAPSVSQQTREIGIRIALGAPRRTVLGHVLRQGTVVALVGIAIGLAGSFGLTRLIANQLFGVSASDPTTFVIVATLLMLVTLTACYLPARRATKVDPMAALRHE